MKSYWSSAERSGARARHTETAPAEGTPMKWSIAGAAFGGLLTAAIALLRPRPVQVDVLRWRDLIEWFTRRADTRAADPDQVAFTLLRRPAPPIAAQGPRTRLEARSRAP